MAEIVDSVLTDKGWEGEVSSSEYEEEEEEAATPTPKIFQVREHRDVLIKFVNSKLL